MEIDPEIKIVVLDGVYPPSDDTYLLIESIEIGNHKRALDMGCGTGIIALHMAKNGLDVVAVDINKKSVENTLLNAKINNLNIKVIEGDLFSRVRGKFDIITFNPPYLPTKNEDISWDGGKGGIEIIERFLEDVYRFMTIDGEIYMVVSSFTDVKRMIKEFKDTYIFEVIKSASFFFEKIYTYRLMLV